MLSVQDAGLREETKLGADVVEGVFDLVAHGGGRFGSLLGVSIDVVWLYV